MMDSRFFGLIFSCFYRDPAGLNKLIVTSFQASPSRETCTIPIELAREHDIPNAQTAPHVQLPRLYFEEEKVAYGEALAAINGHSSDAAVLLAAGQHTLYLQSLLSLSSSLHAPMLGALRQRQRAYDVKVRTVAWPSRISHAS